MSTLVWEVEWRVALARRRLFALNVAVPLLLVAAIAFSAAPAVHAAAVYAVLFVLHPVFGSAVPLVRDAERGLVARILRGGVGPASYLLQRTAAAAVLDLVQLAPAVILAAWGLGAGPAGAGVVLVGVALAVWVGNLVGVAVAALARSVAETALFAALAGLLLLHASGVFRTPASGSFGAAAEAVSPFRLLHEALLAGSGPGPSAGAGSALAWALALPMALVFLATLLGRALSSGAGEG